MLQLEDKNEGVSVFVDKNHISITDETKNSVTLSYEHYVFVIETVLRFVKALETISEN